MIRAIPVCNSIPLYDNVLKGKDTSLGSVANLCRLANIDLSGLQEANENFNLSEDATEEIARFALEQLKAACPTKEQYIYRCLKLDEWSHKMGSAEAAKRIYRCITEKGTTLDLSNTGIHEIPDWIGKLRHIEELDVSSNDIYVPFMQYPWSIRVLNISDTGMKLPPFFSSGLSNLTHLYARNNGLTVLDQPFTQYPKIQEIDLRGNRIAQNYLKIFEDALHVKAPEFDNLICDPLSRKRAPASDERGKAKKNKLDEDNPIFREFDKKQEEETAARAQERAEAKAHFRQMTKEEQEESRVQDLKTLGLPTTASKRDIRLAYRELILKTHPDKTPRFQEETEEAFAERIESAAANFREVQEAYERLTHLHQH